MKHFPVLFAALMLALPASAQRFVKTVNTVADLVALNPNDIHNVATIKWKTAEGTADEGDVFYYSAASVLATNTTTVFKPTNFGGRWIRGNAAAAGSGTPGAPLGSLQFNQAGSLAGVTSGTLQAHTNLLSLGWPIYNVKNFGAEGDGSNEDNTEITTTIQASQTQARPPIVFFPPGVYNLDASLLITNSNVTLQGAGETVSILRVTTSGIGQAILVNNSAARLFNVHIKGLRIEGTNGLASPPDGIVMRNVSQWKIEEVWGTGLNNGFVVDGSEVAAIRDSILSLNVAGVYLTSQDGSLAVSEVLVDNLIADHNTNATVLVDGAAAKLTFKNSRFENTTRGFLFRNRAGTDVEQDVVTIEDVFVQNNVGEGFEKGTFLLAQPSNVTNYHILQNLSVLNSRGNLTGASNAIEFIKGSNTNVSTAAHDVSIQRSMFASITNSAIYSDHSGVNGEIYQLWTQGGLPETSGSGTWTRELYPAGLLWRDTNNVQGTLLTRLSDNGVSLRAFSTNSYVSLVVPDNQKSFVVDIGDNGNDFTVADTLVSFADAVDIAGQINAGSENRNITTAAGRVDIDQFSTNTALVNYVPTFDGANVVWAAQVGGGGTNAAGSATEVQFRNGATGVFAADTDFQYDSTNNVLDVTSTVQANKVQATNQFKLMSAGTNALHALDAAGNTVLTFNGSQRALTVGISNTLSSIPHVNGFVYASGIGLYQSTNDAGGSSGLDLFGANGNSISIATYLRGTNQENYELTFPSNAPSATGIQLLSYSNNVPRFVDATLGTGNFVGRTGTENIAGAKSFTTSANVTTTNLSVADDPYDATGWNGNTNVPTKNAVRDKIESMGAGSGDMVKAQSNLVTGTVLYQMVAAQVTGTNVFIDSSTNIVFHNITTNFALVFTNWSNNTGEKKIIITEDATGGHAPAFESTVLFENSPSTTHATAPSFPTNAGISYVLWAYERNGTNWIRGPSTVALSAATTSALFGTGVGTDPAFRAIADADVPNTITIDLATLASTVTVVDSTDATSFPLIADSATGSLAAKTDGGLTYNASTASLAATTFVGALTGNADSATLAATSTVVDSTDATSFVAVFDSATGSLPVKTDGALLYDASNGTLSSTTFAGAGGGLTLDASGFNGNLTTSDNTLQEVAQKLDDLSVGAGGNVALTDFNTNQFDTNNATWKIAIKSGATITNTALITPKDAIFTNLTATAYLSAASNPADAGVVRLGNNEKISWEAATPGTDLDLLVDATDILNFTGAFTAVTITENGDDVPNDTDHLGFFAATTSQQLADVLSNETGTGAAVFSSGANLTNIVVTGQTNTDLTASLPVFTDATKKLTSTGTIDLSSANITGKQIRSLKFVASSFRLVDNAGCTIPNTNDFTLNTFMVPQFSGTGASNANFMRFMCRVPKHIDTSVAMTASISVELTAADTAAHSYHVGVVSVANSAQIDTAATTFIDMAITGDGAGVAEDITSVNDVTLTGWAATLTANQWMVVELRRNGADTSTVASRFQELEIFYTESQ